MYYLILLVRFQTFSIIQTKPLAWSLFLGRDEMELCTGETLFRTDERQGESMSHR